MENYLYGDCKVAEEFSEMLLYTQIFINQSLHVYYKRRNVTEDTEGYLQVKHVYRPYHCYLNFLDKWDTRDQRLLLACKLSIKNPVQLMYFHFFLPVGPTR